MELKEDTVTVVSTGPRAMVLALSADKLEIAKSMKALEEAPSWWQ